MQTQPTISDAIAKLALQYGLFESNHIEKLLINQLNQRKTKKQAHNNGKHHYRVAEAWDDFSDTEHLQANLIPERKKPCKP